MKLLTKELANKIPKLYETEEVPVSNKVALVKLFHPVSNWTWYVMEYDGKDTCWGLVVGHETELGYFSLSELDAIESPFDIRVERDIFFRPTTVAELGVLEYAAVA